MTKTRKKPQTKWRGIVKVQRSMYPDDSLVSARSEDMSVYYQGPLEPKIAAWFSKDGIGRLKFYAHAELIGTIIKFTKKADWQDW